jgi:hypothetical protein
MNEINQNLKIKRAAQKKNFLLLLQRTTRSGKDKEREIRFIIPSPARLKREREREIIVSADLQRSFTEEL